MKVLVGRILRPFAITMGALVVFTGITPPAVAADKGALEEVVVTARYRAEKLQDTPIAITAITAQDLQVRGFSSSYEIGYTVPNASLRPAQAAFGNTMTAYIRGIGQYDFNFAFEPGVAIYVDDTYQPFTLGSEVDLLDLERVEVLRGPQGTLFGRGAIGGAIRYVSKKPEGNNTGFIDVTAGDYGRVDVRAGYDFALTKNLYARVTGVSKHRKGYQDVIDFACAHPLLAGTLTPKTTNRGNGCKIGTQGGENVSAIRGIIRYAPSDDLDMTLSANYTDDSSEAKADTLLHALNVWPSFYSIPFDQRFVPPTMYQTYATYDDPNNNLSIKPQNTMKKWTITGRSEWKMNDAITATGIVSYTKMRGTLSTDADQSPLNLQLVDGIEKVDYFQGEVRLSGRLWDRMDWTVGGFYYTGNADDTQMVSIPFLSLILDGNPPTSGIPFVNSNNLHKNFNESGFATAVYDFTDKLSFTAGVRYSHDRKEVNFDNTRVQNPNVVVDDNHFDWKVGVNYKWTDDIMTYASVATGYRPGSYNPRPFQVTQVVSVDQEESTAYEIGIKSDWLDRSLRVNLAGFYTDWSTRIVPVGGTECLVLSYPPAVYATVPVGTPGSSLDSLGNNCLDSLHISRTLYQNGPGEIYGFEAEVAWQPIERLTLNGAYGLTEWHSADINNDPTVISSYPPYVPKQNWTVSASYEIPVFGNGSTLTPRLDVYAQSEICSANVLTTAVFPDASCTKAYKLLNFRMEYASPNRDWTLAAGVTNLTDQEYYLNKFDLTAFGQPTAEGQPGHPREWYVTVRRNFD